MSEIIRSSDNEESYRRNARWRTEKRAQEIDEVSTVPWLTRSFTRRVSCDPNLDSAVCHGII